MGYLVGLDPAGRAHVGLAPSAHAPATRYGLKITAEMLPIRHQRGRAIVHLQAHFGADEGAHAAPPGDCLRTLRGVTFRP